MTHLFVYHDHMTDYGKFMHNFEGHTAARKKHGCVSSAIYKSEGKVPEVVVQLEFPTRGQAEAFKEEIQGVVAGWFGLGAGDDHPRMILGEQTKS